MPKTPTVIFLDRIAKLEARSAVSGDILLRSQAAKSSPKQHGLIK
jgi:hypothetical protein